VSSLQDQLLKAGLTDKKKLKQASKNKRKEENLKRHNKQEIVDETKQAAQQALAEKTARSQELARQQNAEAEKKAIAAQIRQLIELNRQPRQGGEIAYNFSDGKHIKKLLVTSAMQAHLISGKLAIVKLGDSYELVPAPIAEKIEQRDPAAVLVRNDSSSEIEDEDDPYADYKIPDDLMW
jgi:uncharacterized protein YaiL (DUF2058 family)